MSVGVGRGRGRLPQQSNDDIEPLRRPNITTVGRGRLISSNSAVSSKFSDIESSLSHPDVDSVKLFVALNDFLQSNPTPDDLDVLVKKVFDKGIRSDVKIDCICQCVYLASKHFTKGGSLYESFFAQLEKRFKGLDSLKDSASSTSLWRFRLLFSSVCQFVRNQSSPPFKELVDGLTELCLNMPQPADAYEARIAALCVARCCHYMKLYKSPNDKIEALMNKLRSVIRGCSSIGCTDKDMVTWLSLGLETACLISSSLQISPSTLQYYCRTLDPTAAAFDIISPPTINLPSSSKQNYNFDKISYIVNFI